MFQFGIQLSEIKALRKGFCNPASNEKRAKFTIMTHAPLLDRPCFYIGPPRSNIETSERSNIRTYKGANLTLHRFKFKYKFRIST